MKTSEKLFTELQALMLKTDEHRSITEITLSANFSIDLGLDTDDINILLMHVERKFDVKISHEEQDHINTVGDLVALLEKKWMEQAIIVSESKFGIKISPEALKDINTFEDLVAAIKIKLISNEIGVEISLEEFYTVNTSKQLIELAFKKQEEQQVLAEIQKVVTNEYGPSKGQISMDTYLGKSRMFPTPEQRLQHYLELDDLERVLFIKSCEESLGVEVMDCPMNDVKTIRSIVHLFLTAKKH